MAFPSIADLILSAQNVKLIKDPFLKGYPISLNIDKTPYMFGGGFSQVFKIVKPESQWAFKVWRQEIPENEERHTLIKEYLKQIKSPYFLDFEYVPKGILINGELFPTLRMPWVDGSLLKYYINLHIDDSQTINNLAENFLQMTKSLHENSISHGDLKNDNIFVTDDGQIRLIDYDSVCVPTLVDRDQNCRGTDGFQHPFRGMLSELSSLKVDYFSELVIYLSLKALSENPTLWTKYNVMQADYRLLFTSNDFKEFRNSMIRNDLMNLSDEIKDLVVKMDTYIHPLLYLVPIS